MSPSRGTYEQGGEVAEVSEEFQEALESLKYAKIDSRADGQPEKKLAQTTSLPAPSTSRILPTLRYSSF